MPTTLTLVLTCLLLRKRDECDCSTRSKTVVFICYRSGTGEGLRMPSMLRCTRRHLAAIRTHINSSYNMLKNQSGDKRAWSLYINATSFGGFMFTNVKYMGEIHWWAPTCVGSCMCIIAIIIVVVIKIMAFQSSYLSSSFIILPQDSHLLLSSTLHHHSQHRTTM